MKIISFRQVRVFVIVLFLIVFQNKVVYSQDNLIIDTYSAFETNGKVYLDWIIKTGNTCNGIGIQRSIDSINFNTIAHIEGVCGNLNSPQPFSYIDEAPVKNRINYYRLELGGKGFTRALAIEFIDLSNETYQLRPNPCSQQTRLYFDNPGKEVVSFNLYHQNAKELYNEKLNGEYIDIDTSTLSSGIYVFTISNQQTKLLTAGKIIVQK